MSSSSESPPARPAVSLLREAQTRFVSNAIDGFRFTVTAHSNVGMPAEVFLFLRHSADPTTGGESDEFSNVCSAPDLAEYPAHAPTGRPRFFRGPRVDLVFRSVAESEEAWLAIVEDVAGLVRTLRANEALAVADDLRFGD